MVCSYERSGRIARLERKACGHIAFFWSMASDLRHGICLNFIPLEVEESERGAIGPGEFELAAAVGLVGIDDLLEFARAFHRLVHHRQREDGSGGGGSGRAPEGDGGFEGGEEADECHDGKDFHGVGGSAEINFEC